VLCLHGFTGTPFDVAPLASALETRGYHVCAPMLPGHGGGVDALAAIGADDWLRAADAQLTRLSDDTGCRVAIAGGSMGALLALRLARRRPEAIAAIVLMAAPLRWRPIERRGVEVLCRMARLFRMSAAAIPKTGGVDAVDPVVRRTAPSIEAYPITALHHLITLTDAAAADAPSVTAPALIVHGRQDRTVPLDVSEQLAASLGSDVVERLWLEDSGHLVAADCDRDKVAAVVSDFLARQARWLPAARSANQPQRA
jgi:carboxylesterase